MQNRNQLNAPKEPIQIIKPLGRSTKRFLTFLICAAILVAAFAVSGAWMKRSGMDFLDGWGNFFGGREEQTTDEKETAQEGNSDAPRPERDPTSDAENEQGNSSLPVVSLDLSCAEYGRDYISNETVYRPNVQALREQTNEAKTFDPQRGPVVLVLHTHASEAYRLENGVQTGSLGDAWYANDPSRTVISVGKALSDSLNKNGIPAIHCAEMHGEDGTLRGSYADAAKCIDQYLKRYPTIQYVIDVHRDGILDSNGVCVRTLAEQNGASMAQVMAVVGTDGNGDSHPNWEGNLSLALRLRDGLEDAAPSVSRPVLLRNATYNQETVPNALLLEIGSAGNSVEEAIRTAQLVGETFAKLLLGS